MNNNQFASRAGFIMAAVGSAIGLGNIWRFPGVAYDNGGGAFFIPYLVALLTTGLGLLILEFALGNRFRGSSPLTLARIHKKFEVLGWFQVLVTFIISTFYSVVLAYSLRYLYESFTMSWGDNPESYFYNNVLHISANADDRGSMVLGIVLPLLIVWAITLFVIFRGVQKGIESFNKVMIPLLVGLFSIIVIRAVTMPGALKGLDALFTPDWGAITDPTVWVAAYGQIFFSLSLAMGVMVTYSAYMPKRSELSNSALIAGFANSSFELLAGIGVFSALGYLATNSGQEVQDVAASGMSLAFIAFPAILNTMPGATIFSILFFGCLVIAGLTSLVSILEVGIAAISEKFNLKRSVAASAVAIPSLIISFIFTFQNGLYVLDIVDYFTNNIGITAAALTLIVCILFIAKQGNSIISYINTYSDIKIGGMWKFSLTILSPALIAYMLVNTVYTVFTVGYGDYASKHLMLYGWGVIGFFLVGAFAFTLRSWNKDIQIQGYDSENEDDVELKEVS
ncbi:MAG: sodium-dependent transporter [Bacilli bacterium]